jgi:hypothetical protein
MQLCLPLMASNDASDDEVLPEEDFIAQIDRENAQQVEGSIGSDNEPDLYDDFQHLLTLLIMSAAYNSEGVPLLKNTANGNQNLNLVHEASGINVLHALTTVFV